MKMNFDFNRKFSQFTILVALSSLCFVGCKIPVIEGQDISFGVAERQATLRDCRGLESHGNFVSLREQIKLDIQRVRVLTEGGYVRSHEAELTRISQRIQEKSLQMGRILDPQYTRIDRDQNIEWDLSEAGLGLSRSARKHWAIQNMSIEKVYSWKGEDSLLKESLYLEWLKQYEDGEGNYLSLARPASLLEVCQLQETILIVLKVDFEGKNKETETRFYQLRVKSQLPE